MSIRLNLFIIILVSIFFAHCVTTYKIGKQFSTENVAKIVIGKTTEQDILAFFGDPWKIGILNGNVVYTYCYEEWAFQRDDTIEKRGDTLVIEFDANKKVKNYYFNIPGKEPIAVSLIIHKKNMDKQQEEQMAMQNQMTTSIITQ